MPKADDIRWFKEQFQTSIEAAIQGTPFSVDMITAVACQETGFIWQILRKRQLSVDRILELCVGDTIDAKPGGAGRRAFPKTKAELLSKPRGDEMFTIARQALVDMAQHINGFSSAVANPNKFCHGFGIFQFDLQFFLKEPDYFLQKRFANFDDCLEKCVGELTNAQRRIDMQNRISLSDLEMASVAIAYNTGGFKPSKGLKQGHFNGSKFYGEEFFDFLRLSKTVVVQGESSPTPAPQPAPATGPLYEVDVRESPLFLRREPKRDPANVQARLPDGHIVRAVTNVPVNGFLEVETSLQGVKQRGFASKQFLKLSQG
jgi:hypothetical protein